MGMEIHCSMDCVYQTAVAVYEAVVVWSGRIWEWLTTNISAFCSKIYECAVELFANQPPPPPVPAVIQGSVSILLRTTGYVGMDRRYNFRQMLKLAEGGPLRVEPTDFLCRVEVTIGGEVVHDELPSSLFEQARIGDRIRFMKEDRAYDFQLEPHVKGASFDDCFTSAHEELKYMMREFLHEADIPDTYHRWSPESFILSPEAQRIQLDKSGVVPLDFAALKPISSDDLPLMDLLSPPKREEYGEEVLWRYRMVACGRPDIDIVLDRTHLYVHIVKTECRARSIAGPGIPTEGCLHILCVEPEMKVDPENIKAHLDDSGILTLTVPFRSLGELIPQDQFSRSGC